MMHDNQNFNCDRAYVGEDGAVVVWDIRGRFGIASIHIDISGCHVGEHDGVSHEPGKLVSRRSCRQ
jgi:hypothetical protein